ncbi:hypothetical protein E1180_18380 [Roseibium denhamense]|nr:hypothetical protein [Roseibium denhamense]
MRRKRPAGGQSTSERQSSFAAHLPTPAEPVLERKQDAFARRYRPNSAFLAHLIATHDADLDQRSGLALEPENGIQSYRATAALPRQRGAGHILKTER